MCKTAYLRVLLFTSIFLCLYIMYLHSNIISNNLKTYHEWAGKAFQTNLSLENSNETRNSNLVDSESLQNISCVSNYQEKIQIFKRLIHRSSPHYNASEELKSPCLKTLSGKVSK